MAARMSRTIGPVTAIPIATHPAQNSVLNAIIT
jgi:hypothetical protein